jgi:hypothetical protein
MLRFAAIDLRRRATPREALPAKVTRGAFAGSVDPRLTLSQSEEAAALKPVSLCRQHKA